MSARMPEPEDEIEQIIANVIERHGATDPMRTMRAIIEGLWEAGYEIRPKPDIVRSP